MRIYIYLILICFSVFCNLNAQTGIVGYEKYNSYEQCIYVDNLAQKLFLEIFVSTYSKFKPSDFKNSQIIDTIHKKREVHIRTKKAKDGYIFVNKSIMAKIANLDCDLDKLKVSYVYNNKMVTTKEDVMRIVKLREKCIQISEILYDEQSGMVTVCIFDK